MNRDSKQSRIWLLLAGLLIAAVIDVAWGSVSIPWKTWTLLLSANQSPDIHLSILRDIRLPHAVTAVLAGAALGCGGLIMQTLLKNPLAEPYVLGLSSGASLGVMVVSIFLGGNIGAFHGFSTVSSSFLGSIAILLVILWASKKTDSTGLLIIGLMTGYFAYALVSLLIFFRSPEELQSYFSWTLGSFSGTDWMDILALTLILLPCFTAIFFRCKILNCLHLGDDFAQKVGISAGRERWVLLLLVSAMAASVTSWCGPIAFLGIAAPHLARMLLRSANHFHLFPATAIIGSILAVVAGTLARAPWSPNSLPFNAVSAMFGAPIVIYVLMTRSRRKNP
jgi:iron complex transport system permease protein